MSGRRGPLSEGTPKEREARGLTAVGTVPVEAEAPKPPPFVKGEARREWRRVTAQLVRQGRIALTDRGVLAAYCETWANWLEVSKTLAEQRALIGSAAFTDVGMRGVVPAAEVTIQRGYARDLVTLSRELGLTISTRLRLPSTDVKAPDAADELEARRKERAAERGKPQA